VIQIHEKSKCFFPWSPGCFLTVGQSVILSSIQESKIEYCGFFRMLSSNLEERLTGTQTSAQLSPSFLGALRVLPIDIESRYLLELSAGPGPWTP